MASRTTKLLSVAAIAALALTGCSSSKKSSSSDASAAKPVTLTFWGTYGNGGNKAQTDALSQTIIPAFEKANPNIKINYVDIPYDSLLQKLTTSAAGGELPDLVRSDIGWVPKFAALKVFAPIDSTLANFSTLSADNYPGSLATNKYNGHYYGLPLDTNTRVLISNGTALKDAGIAAPPATFEDLKTDAAKLAAKKVSVFADSGLQGWNVYPWIWSAGGEVTSPDLTKATGYLNSPASVAGVQMLVDLYKSGAIPNLIIGNKGATQTSDGLPKANYANILDGPWMQAIWQGQYPKFTPVYSPVPAGPGGSISVVGGEDINVTTSSKHQDAALKFIAFTQTADYQLAMAKTGQMSVVKSLDSQEASTVPAFAPYIKQLQTARPRPSVPQAPAIDTALQNELTKAFQGSESVQQALDNAAKTIDPLLTQTN
ncbi:MAG: extracellular solute-binding protein [Actinomycetota bacterium]|nr:extracellular solute-binding protein [Actinomycetota bacterium]MDQ2956856.1 extracellular solute-binding protein [Actinomycetota bacterium]